MGCDSRYWKLGGNGSRHCEERSDVAIHLSLIMDCFVVPPRNDVPAAILSPHDDGAGAPLGRTMTYPALGLFWPWPARHRRRGMAVVDRRMGNGSRRWKLRGNDSRHCEERSLAERRGNPLVVYSGAYRN